MKILVVDDSKTMRTIIRRNLDSLGKHEIYEAEDGQKGFNAVNAASFDVIISDWNMPHMNGLEFLKAVRDTNKSIPFVMITTEAERSNVVAAIQAGVSDYLVKPFSKEGLSEKLTRWIPLNV